MVGRHLEKAQPRAAFSLKNAASSSTWSAGPWLDATWSEKAQLRAAFSLRRRNLKAASSQSFCLRRTVSKTSRKKLRPVPHKKKKKTFSHISQIMMELIIRSLNRNYMLLMSPQNILSYVTKKRANPSSHHLCKLWYMIYKGSSKDRW